MTPGMRALLAVISAGILIAAWMNRFETVRANDAAVYVTDRWTGSIYSCDVTQCYKLPK
jgi:hypothetical protein